ncbi:hypothetical protein LZZ85_13255 [Terrimonas sp. NA20]|uniref:Uncharacterized protein n=1 Tax=Terrimonas ginsenosidimutans TaxID=2908004 RepID=A0ABS9KSF5_9BACT|nr:hypothetical protein [Terrimonas ginsenosidimutans]MCG2615262.1 hypothetical protein [Terrimonas ginsenosidimutans]
MNTTNVVQSLHFPISMGNNESFVIIFRIYHQASVYYAKRFVGDEEADDLD